LAHTKKRQIQTVSCQHITENNLFLGKNKAKKNA